MRRRLLLTAMLVSLAWALAVWVTGGFLWETSSFRLSSRDPFRPLVIGILSALAFWYAAPEVVCRLVDRLERVIAGRSVPIVVTAAALTAAIGLIWGTHAAGGADSYGYVSQADLWLTGHLRIDQRSFQPPVWPFDDWSFAPLGYKPGPEPHTIVPTYSSGLPLLMAGAKFVGGSIGLYSVVPLLGGLAVLLTFLLGRLLFDDMVGVAASLLLAASPAFLFQIVCPMSDVPVATAWTFALVFAVLGRPLAAGIASSLAIVIRPNLVPLELGVGAIASFAGALGGDGGTSALKRAVLFGAGTLPGIVGIAALNTYLYGDPLKSGYGSLESLYRWDRLRPNMTRYARWLLETQTPLAFAAILPLVSRRFTIARKPGGQWHVRVGLALFLAFLLASYMFYLPFEDWWYLRFLLPGFPILLVLAVGFLRSTSSLLGRVGHAVLLTTVVLIVFGWEAMTGQSRGVYRLQRLERRYVTIGRELAVTTPSNAIFFAMQQSGSLRYYTGRPTVRYDLLPPNSLDRAVDVLRSRGFHPYFLLEWWEEPAFRERFGQTSAAGHLDWPPARDWSEPGHIALYDPADLTAPHLIHTARRPADRPE